MQKPMPRSNNQLSTSSPRLVSDSNQPQPLGEDVDQEHSQSTSDSEPLNWLSSSSEAFCESPNTWATSILPMQPIFPAMVDDRATLGHGILCGMSGVVDSNDPSSTDVGNIFDAVLDTQAAYHHTNSPSQPARLDENVPERRAGRASLPGGNLTSAVAAGERTSSKCECFSNMARLLEAIGEESTEAGADMLLMCVDRGMRACREALRCSDCNVFGDSGMFLATVVNQLAIVTLAASDKLLAWSRDNRNCEGPAAEIHNPAVWLGRYRIEMPDLKVQLVHQVALLHLSSLRDLSSGIKDKVRPSSMAWLQITDCESKLVDALRSI